MFIPHRPGMLKAGGERELLVPIFYFVLNYTEINISYASRITMNQSQQNDSSLLPWKRYVSITIESLLAFYIATFCIAMYFTHLSTAWIIPGTILIVLYLFVIFVCIRRIIQTLSIAALMLIIPIAPLIVLTTVISLIPLLQKL